MSSSAVRWVHEVFERFEAWVVEGVVGLFAADGVLADPHYPPPIGPAMVGHQAIREGSPGPSPSSTNPTSLCVTS